MSACGSNASDSKGPVAPTDVDEGEFKSIALVRATPVAQRFLSMFNEEDVWWSVYGDNVDPTDNQGSRTYGRRATWCRYQYVVELSALPGDRDVDSLFWIVDPQHRLTRGPISETTFWSAEPSVQEAPCLDGSEKVSGPWTPRPTPRVHKL
jgi:hypothetical protein